MDPLLGYQLGILVVLLWLFSNTAAGLRAFLRLSGYAGRPPAVSPLVSVLVVTRNSARTVIQCLESLLAQNYLDFEVLVLDDHSDDRTALMTAALSEHDLRLRAVPGKPRPAGWLDRTWAFHQLARQAAGDYLLLVEPDVIVQPNTLAAAVDAAEQHGADLISVWPRTASRSLRERLALPLQRFLVFSFLPVRLVAGRVEANFGAINPRVLLVRHATYDTAGGHDAVRCDRVAEVSIARHAQRRGARLAVLDGTDMAQAAPRSNAGDLWREQALNLFAILNYSLPSLVAVLALCALLFIAPFGFVAWAAATGRASPAWLWIPLYQVAVNLAIGVLIAQRFASSVGDTALQPLAMAIFEAAVLGNLWAMVLGAGFGRAGACQHAGLARDQESVVQPKRSVRQRDD